MGQSYGQAYRYRGHGLEEETNVFTGTDDLIERTRKALKRDNASTHSIGNLKNWLDDSACLARDETDYLSQAEDLMAIASTADDKIPSLLQRSIEDSIIWAAEVVGKV